jgi:hypothetical protein
MAGQQMWGEDDSDCDLLDQEKDNAANSRILDKQIIIYFKKRVGGSHDISKLAEV